jgi:Exostosin family
VPHIATPELPFRENMWSFAGTDWKGRKDALAVLQSIQPHFLRWFDQWQHPNQLTEEEYLGLLLNSKFVPCPRGQNIETYRFYEALDCGCIPLFIREEGDEAFLKQFDGYMPFINLTGWDHAAALMLHLSQNHDMMDKYRKGILIGWARYKMTLKERVRKWFSVGKIEVSTIVA